MCVAAQSFTDPPIPVALEYGPQDDYVVARHIGDDGFGICCNSTFNCAPSRRRTLTEWTSFDGTYGTHEYILRGRGGTAFVRDAFVTAAATKNTTYLRYFTLTVDDYFLYAQQRDFRYFSTLSATNFTQCAYTAGYITRTTWALRIVLQWYDATRTGPEYLIDFSYGDSAASASVALSVVVALMATVLFAR